MVSPTPTPGSQPPPYAQPPYAQPPYAQPPYAQAPYAPRPLPTSTKGPTIMLAIGIALLVLAVAAAAAAIAGISGLAQLGTGARELSLVVSDDGETRAMLPPLEPGTEYVLCSAMGLPLSQVRITQDSAEGSQVATSEPAAKVNVTINGYSRVPQVQFTAGGASDYVATFDSELTLTPTTGIWVAEYAPFERFGWNLFAAIGGIITAVFGGMVGLGLTIGGGVWRSRRTRNAKLLGGQGQPQMAAQPTI